MQTSLLPASEDLLILYAAQLSTRLLHSSIRSYLSAVRNLHIMHGCGDSMAGRLKFEQFMKGIKRINPSSSDRRLPVLPFILTKVCQVLERNPHDKDNIMFWAACCLVFFAILRSGEFKTPSHTSFDPSKHLSAQDISVDDSSNPSKLFIHLKSSKCDQTRQGITLCVGKTDSLLCPVAAVLAYISVRGTDTRPLFIFQDLSPLTQPRLVSWLRSTLSMAGLDSSNY